MEVIQRIAFETFDDLEPMNRYPKLEDQSFSFTANLGETFLTVIVVYNVADQTPFISIYDSSNNIASAPARLTTEIAPSIPNYITTIPLFSEYAITYNENENAFLVYKL